MSHAQSSACGAREAICEGVALDVRAGPARCTRQAHVAALAPVRRACAARPSRTRPAPPQLVYAPVLLAATFRLRCSRHVVIT